MSERLLIVNADDYGLTRGVCRAIMRAHEEGILTSTSALAVGPAFGECGRWLLDVPSLGVGVHLALVGEDPPLLTAAEVPTLVDRRGRFPLSWRTFLPRFAAGRVDRGDVRRELSAQIEAVQAAVGAERLTHLDSHQHVHLWPALGRMVCELAHGAGIPAVRVPLSLRRAPKHVAVARLSRRTRRLVTHAGLLTTDAFAGFDEGGALITRELVATIDRLGALGAATSELGLHPGEHDDPDLHRYAWGYRWGDELDALVSSEARGAVERNGFRLGSYATLAGVA